MKIQTVTFDNRRRSFRVKTRRGLYEFPYARLEMRPSRTNRVVRAFPDRELGAEAFTYELQSGAQGSVPLDAVLDYNEDPGYLTDLFLYNLTVEARRRVAASSMGTRELARRLATSASQLYRLLDPTNYRKSVRQMLELLYALDCQVDFVVRRRKSA